MGVLLLTVSSAGFFFLRFLISCFRIGVFSPGILFAGAFSFRIFFSGFFSIRFLFSRIFSAGSLLLRGRFLPPVRILLFFRFLVFRIVPVRSLGVCPLSFFVLIVLHPLPEAVIAQGEGSTKLKLLQIVPLALNKILVNPLCREDTDFCFQPVINSLPEFGCEFSHSTVFHGIKDIINRDIRGKVP